ncbi:MAG: putative photosynthetic complex assembly protein PuhE [Halorhodospira sp.]
MVEYLLPALYALFLWWFSTGAVIYLDNLPVRTFRWSMLGCTGALAVGIYGIAVASTETSIAGAYTAFTGALLVWAWIELSYYTNYVTGPRQIACTPDCRGWRHFWHALQSNIYHELAILLLGAVIFALTWGDGNRTALWTFLVLAWMHESARINVFLGVRNLNEELVPEHMDFLRSFMRRRPMNLFFPLSVSLSTVALVLLVQAAAAPAADSFMAVSLTLVATLMALAILEHWFLVTPLPTAFLWRWGLRARDHNTRAGLVPRPSDPADVDASP